MPSVDCRTCGHTIAGDGQEPITYNDCPRGHNRAALCGSARICTEIYVREGKRVGEIPPRGREFGALPLDS